DPTAPEIPWETHVPLDSAWRWPHHRPRRHRQARRAPDLAFDDRDRCPARRGDVRRNLPGAAADRVPTLDDAAVQRPGHPAVPGHHRQQGAQLSRLLLRLHRPHHRLHRGGLDGRGARRGDDHGPPAGGPGAVGGTDRDLLDHPADAPGGDGLDRRPDRFQSRPDRLRELPAVRGHRDRDPVRGGAVHCPVQGHAGPCLGAAARAGRLRRRGAAWIGLPQFHTPEVSWGLLPMFLPVVLVLLAENVGHVTSVGLMTGRNLDHMVGRTLASDGIATALSAGFGGSPTTTYGENIGVMSATRVYSTAAYWVAGFAAIALSLSPKVGALIFTIPPGVLGGATFVLYGLIGIVGVRMWVDGKVDFSKPKNQFTAGVALVVGIADVTWEVGGIQLTGIALGTLAALIIYHLMSRLGRATGTEVDWEETPAFATSRPGSGQVRSAGDGR